MTRAETSPVRAISLPHEHGGTVTLAGVAVAAALAARDPFAALGVVVALAAAFFAHAPLERWAVRLPLRRRDPAALATLGALAAVGIWLAGRLDPLFSWAAFTAGAAVLAGAIWARRSRFHRSAGFEAVALGGLGASSALATLAGGAPASTAVVMGLVLGVHAGLSVPLVRGALRKGKRATRAGGPALALILVATVATLIPLGAAPAALALTPRAIQVGRFPSGPAAASVAGLVETAALAATVAILLVAL